MQTYSSALDEFEKTLVHPKAGRTLIVGSQVYGTKEDRRGRYQNVVGADMQPGPGVDLVIDLEEPLPDGLGLFDHIECMSVLEHSRRPWLLAANIERLLAPGGTLFVSVPFVWRFHGYPNDYFRVSCEGIRALFRNIDWAELRYAHEELTEKAKIPREVRPNGHWYLARTEACGFGRKMSMI